MTSGKQRANTWAMMMGAMDYCKAHRFSRAQAHQHVRECLMCCQVESLLWIWANVNVPDSFRQPHDRVGSDHYSVGMFQQQVPMWGTTYECMNPQISAHKFLERMTELGLDALVRGSPWVLGSRVQQVQVSAFPDRYAAQYGWAGRYLHYNFRWRRLLRASNYPSPARDRRRRRRQERRQRLRARR